MLSELGARVVPPLAQSEFRLVLGPLCYDNKSAVLGRWNGTEWLGSRLESGRPERGCGFESHPFRLSLKQLPWRKEAWYGRERKCRGYDDYNS